MISVEVKTFDDRRIESEKPRAGDHVAAECPAKTYGRQDKHARIEQLGLAEVGWNACDSGRQIWSLLVVGSSIPVLIEGENRGNGDAGLSRQDSAQLPSRNQYVGDSFGFIREASPRPERQVIHEVHRQVMAHVKV